jgi:hypothetical protein
MKSYVYFEDTFLPMETDIEYKHMTQNLDTETYTQNAIHTKNFLFLE